LELVNGVGIGVVCFKKADNWQMTETRSQTHRRKSLTRLIAHDSPRFNSSFAAAM
jgi:hypothetical protein